MKHERISIDGSMMTGKPCIRGIRTTVEHILRERAGGRSIAEIVEAYPRLVEEDIRAAADYAADVIRQVWLTTQPALLGEADNPLSG
jgi:uncharacterized protein (DUF433 family)